MYSLGAKRYINTKIIEIGSLYSHVVPSIQRELASRLDGYYGGTNKK